ncbi:ABC transporter ATP-binding protein [Chlamydiifrater phoenicopteri]|uniref:ABC transporter ATP-binding protein n=1 Tax=Chlamydiifrater phoenicopteri TaxID=2681469 RepID=UPI001BCC8836|nr:ABC transporter ATP-binding protein [Chlamydiifrater phoenicopteri]
MKLLLKAVLRRKKRLFLLGFSLLSIIGYSLASQAEILSLGVIVKTGPDAFQLFGRKDVCDGSQLASTPKEIDRKSLLESFDKISGGGDSITLRQANAYLARNTSGPKKVSITKKIASSIDSWLKLSNASTSYKKFYLLVGVLALVAAFKAITLFFVRYLTMLISIRVSKDLRYEYFSSLQKLPMSFFHSYGIGNLSSRITMDSEQIAEAVNSLFVNYVHAPAMFLLTLAVCYSISWQFSLTVFLGFPILVLPVVFLAKKIKSIARSVQVNKSSFSSILIDFLSGIMTIKLFCTEEFSLQKYSAYNERVAKLEEKSARYGIAPRPILHAAASLFLAIVMLIGLYVFSITPSDLLVFCGLLYLVYEPIKKFADENTQIMKGCAAAERFFEVINLCKEQDGQSKQKSFSGMLSTLEFRNVVFGYGEKINVREPVLRGISFSVKKGESVGIVGPTGSGKSTIMKLLPRLYEIDSGEILIDGCSISSYNVQSLREHIACVPQKPFLFYDSILNNLLLGKIFSKEEVLAALRDAHATEFIDKMPDGIHSILEESGKNLSGGQQQRLTIARALLKKASILLLDEATSSLDAVSENYIKEIISSLKGSCTQIIIAHKLSTLEHVDRIIYVENGRKIAEGTKEELLQSCPGFREMWMLSNSINSAAASSNAIEEEMCSSLVEQ